MRDCHLCVDLVHPFHAGLTLLPVIDPTMKLQWVEAHWPVTDVEAAKKSLCEAVSTIWCFGD